MFDLDDINFDDLFEESDDEFSVDDEDDEKTEQKEWLEGEYVVDLDWLDGEDGIDVANKYLEAGHKAEAWDCLDDEIDIQFDQ